MKLRHKKTGTIYKIEDIDLGNNEDGIWLGMTKYTSLAELNEEWEDVPEEPKDSEYYWYIGYKNDIRRTKYHHTSDSADNQVTATRKEIGNCFESLEEAELAVEKLQAWKRLKDKGFRFEGGDDACISYKTDIGNWTIRDLQDFKTLFGGEE